MGEPLPGSLFAEGRTRWSEGTSFELSAQGYEMCVARANPSREWLEEVSLGPIHLALCVELPTIQMCWRYEGADSWHDAPVSWREELRQQRGVDWRLARQGPARVVQYVVDANTGILLVRREMVMDIKMNHLLMDSIGHQAARYWDQEAFEHAQESMRRWLKSSAGIARTAKMVVRLTDASR